MEKAQQLFTEAGWADSNNDGILDKDGQPLSFTIDTLEEHRALAEAVASLLGDAGIDASVRFWEYSVVQPMCCLASAGVPGRLGRLRLRPVGPF